LKGKKREKGGLHFFTFSLSTCLPSWEKKGEKERKKERQKRRGLKKGKKEKKAHHPVLSFRRVVKEGKGKKGRTPKRLKGKEERKEAPTFPSPLQFLSTPYEFERKKRKKKRNTRRKLIGGGKKKQGTRRFVRHPFAESHYGRKGRKKKKGREQRNLGPSSPKGGKKRKGEGRRE